MVWPFNKRADPDSEVVTSGADLLRALMSDEAISLDQAMNIPAFSGCVNKITDAISTIPIKLYKITEGRLEEVKGDLRTRLLNDDTGDTLDGVQFKKAITKDYLTGKGGYAYIHRIGSRVVSVHYVKESEVSFLYDPDPIFKDYDITIQGISYKPFEFLKILRNTDNGRSGISIIEENKEILGVAYHSLKYEKTLVKTGGNKRGFLKSTKTLAQAAIDKLKEAFKNLYQNNTENVIVLNNGLEFQEASNTSVEMQLNENKKTNGDEICKLFGMPPSMINGGATEQDKIDFVQYCLNPVLKAMECALNRDFLAEKEKGLYFFAADTSELTKGDIEKRFRAYEIAKKNGFFQIDEIRLKENMPPLGIDFVHLGLQDVLFYPETKQFYIPNMNASGGLGAGIEKKEGEET